jgi:hypothetical protein
MGRFAARAMVLVLAFLAVCVPAGAILAAPGETGKYYVVGPPVNGRREYLFAIAAETLGDGKRYREIFALNDGRLQPDGRAMTDATTVEPGWVIVLPKDAEGPGVVNGPLPSAAGTPSKQPSRKPAAAAVSSGPPQDWADQVQSKPRQAPKEESWLFSTTALRVVLILLALILVVWAQTARVSRRRAAREGTGEGPADRRPPRALGVGVRLARQRTVAAGGRLRGGRRAERTPPVDRSRHGTGSTDRG